MTTGGDICKALASGADAVMIGSAFARATEAPGRGYHWGMATPHSNLPRGTRIRVGVAGPLEQILFGPAFTEDGTLNLVGAIRTCMGSVGAMNITRAAADGADHRAVHQDRGQGVPAGPEAGHSALGREAALDKIAILDFGAQYTQLIARRIREMSVYSEILPCTHPVDEVLAAGYRGIVLSGVPRVSTMRAPRCPTRSSSSQGFPCSASATACRPWAISSGARGAGGAARVRARGAPARDRGGLFEGVTPGREGRITVWMSHGDTVLRPPKGFTSLASTANCPVAAMADPDRRLYAVQFHPEVAHTQQGKTVLANFLKVCGVARDWSMASFVDTAVAHIRATVGTDRVLCALSGVWTPRWWRRSSTGPSAISSPASSWTTGSSGRARRKGW